MEEERKYMLYSLIYALACVLLCLSAFFIGLNTGLKVRNNKPMVVTTPATIVRERKRKKEEKKETDRVNAILANIEAYDGTGKGQKVIR